MRRILYCLIIFTVVASASKGLASTDCEKWLAEYKKELAQKQTVQRALAAKNRARAYARRKVGNLIASQGAPAPHPVRSVTPHPHLTPAQMLKKFDLMCGELPTEQASMVLDGRMSPDEFISEVSMGGPVETESGFPGDSLLSSEEPLTYVPTVSFPQTPGENSFVWPTFGTTPIGSLGALVLPPVAPPVVLVPVSSVPEPGGFVLLLTGAAGAVGAFRRRVSF